MNPYHEKYLGLKSIDKKSPAFLCPLFAYIVLKKIVNTCYESLFDEFEYKLGREYSKILGSIQREANLSRVKAINEALKEFHDFGFGTTKIITSSPTKVLLRNNYSPIARQYQRSFNMENKKVDYLLSGMYSGILTSHFDKEIHITEKKCLASGQQTCIFEDTDQVPNSYPKLTTIITEVIRFHRIEEPFVNYPSPLIKNAFEQGHFTKKNGMIKLWSIYSVYFKFGFFAFSGHILTKVRNDIADLYRYLGMIQSNIAVQFQKNQYGITNKDELFNSLLNQLDLFGYGHGTVAHKNEKGLMLKFKNVHLLRQCSRFMNGFEDPYIEGILVGMSQVFNDRVSTIDISSSKIDEMAVNVTFGKTDSLPEQISQKIESENIKDIVNEKMKHKYYLSPE